MTDDQQEEPGYRLHFKPSKPEGLVYQHFHDYFVSRPNYDLDEESAVYTNEQTQAYFWFNYMGQDSPQPYPKRNLFDAEMFATFDILFCYIRNRSAFNEAVSEIMHFMRQLNLRVCDPQGSDQNAYAETFLKTTLETQWRDYQKAHRKPFLSRVKELINKLCSKESSS